MYMCVYVCVGKSFSATGATLPVLGIVSSAKASLAKNWINQISGHFYVITHVTAVI